MTNKLTRRSLGQGLFATGLAGPALLSPHKAIASDNDDFFDVLGGQIMFAQILIAFAFWAFSPTASSHGGIKATGVRLGRGMPQNLIDRAGGLGRAPIRRRFRDAKPVASLHVVGGSNLFAAPQRPQDTMGVEDITFAHNEFEIRPKGDIRTFELQTAITMDQVLGSPRAGTLYRTGDSVLAAIPPHGDLGFV